MEKNNVCPICGSKHIIVFKNGLTVCQSCDAKYVFDRKNEPVSDIYKESVRSVLEIVSLRGGDYFSGTGTIISGKGYLITSLHIVMSIAEDGQNAKNPCDTVIVKSKLTEKLIRSRIVYQDNDLDIALLYSKELSGRPPVKFDNSTPQIGEKVYVIGNSKGEGLCMIDGIISDSLRIVDGRKLTMISAPVTSGCSGGPVLNKSGKMIGIVTGGRKDATAMNYSVPTESILKFIRDAQKEAGIVL